MTRWNEHASGKDAEQLMRYAAYREGLTYHQWCDKYGIIDRAASRRIERHQIQMLTRDPHKDGIQVTVRGDPPHYETADWGPSPHAPTTDNVFEDERRQGRWKAPKK